MNFLGGTLGSGVGGSGDGIRGMFEGRGEALVADHFYICTLLYDLLFLYLYVIVASIYYYCLYC